MKIVAPQESAIERGQLVSIAINAQVIGIPNAPAAPSIPPCQIIDEKKDRMPLLYGPHEFPQTGITIHTSQDNVAAREFLAAIFRSQGISVIGDSVLPPSSPASLVYLEIGHRLSE
jgi:hypothetical protein